jgi:hypothetical protein
MKWIRVAARVSKDAKVRELARRAGVDPHKIVGHLVDLWGEMADQAKDGDLSPFCDEDVEAWAGWAGKGCKPGAFAPALRALLCDERGAMDAWDEYNGAALREHEADRRRKAAKRSGRLPPDVPPDNGRKSASIPPLRDETIRNERTTPSTSHAPATGVVALVEVADRAVRPRLPAEYWPDLDALLERIPPPQRAGWLRSMAAKLDGLHPPAVTPEALGEAVRAFAANGAECKLVLFDGYVRRAAQPPPERMDRVALARPAVAGGGRNRRLSVGAQAEANALRGVALAFGEIPDTHVPGGD